MSAFANQPIQIGSNGVRVPQRGDRVVALLVRYDQDDVGLVWFISYAFDGGTHGR
jgi:hypothetical protein